VTPSLAAIARHAAAVVQWPQSSTRGTAMKHLIRASLLLVLVSMLSACGYNAMQRQDEAVKAAWSEVINQYQRRADLVPNLVNTVKGYAQHEEQVFVEVTNARAKVGSIQVTPELANDPAALQKFQAAQGELSSALSHLMAVSENYPQLKADALFQNLQAQLEGTENRVTVARNRYIQAVQAYNTLLRTFPNNLTAKLFGYQAKPNFTVENEAAISHAPTVDFGPRMPTQVPQAAPAPAATH
jgi:LemA protein